MFKEETSKIAYKTRTCFKSVLKSKKRVLHEEHKERMKVSSQYVNMLISTYIESEQTILSSLSIDMNPTDYK